MQNLLLLQEKLDQLLKAFSGLKEENNRLQKTIDKQREVIRRNEEDMKRLEKDLTSHTLEQVTKQLDEEKRLKLQEELERVIIAIEKNITLLK